MALLGLKIDRSFVQTLVTQVAGAPVAPTVTQLGTQRGVPVLAEGGEDDSQEPLLMAVCRVEAQGHPCARPLPAPELMAGLDARQGTVARFCGGPATMKTLFNWRSKKHPDTHRGRQDGRLSVGQPAGWPGQTRLALLARLGLLAAVMGLAACGKPEPMRLGFVAELSDASADVARSARNGALMALEPWAGASAPHGRPVEMVVRDLGRTDAEAAQAMADMAAAKVVAVVGPLTSGGVARALPLAQKHGILLVSPTATSLDFFGKDDLLFRINGTTRDNGLVYARRCLDKKGLRRVAVAVTTQNSVFAENWLAQFSAAYQAAGGQVVRVVRFDANGTALAGAASELLQAPEPEGLVIVGNAVDTARLAQQVRKVDAQRPILVAEWAATEELIQLGGQAVEGVEMVQLYDRTDSSPRWVDFRDTYERRFKDAPGYASVAGYDAATVLMSALSRGKPDVKLKDALRQHGPFQGLQQSIQFDVNGDTTRRAFFVVVRGGRFQPAD